MLGRSLHSNQKAASTSPVGQSRRAFLGTAATALAFGGLLTGCHELKLRKFWDKEEVLRDNVRSAIKGEEGHSRLIGDYIRIADSTLGYIKVQGVGFVHSLDGTGEDPPAVPTRKMLTDDMRRQGIRNPNTLLSSADTCMVIVTAYIPPIVRKGDVLDVEIKLPDGSRTESLVGGWLEPCRLSEHALLGGNIRTGKDVVIASGPILVNSLDVQASESSVGLKMGRIPGGGKYTGDDRHLTVALRSDYRTVRMSTTVANRVGERFYDYNRSGIQKPLCEAKSDVHLQLIVHERYRENYPRYLQCIRHISLSKESVERHLRMQEIEQAIMFGPTSEKAALELEAIGADAIPTLKRGLTSTSPEARFRSAEALAYLGESDGVNVLRRAAEDEPAFRIFALAALAAVPNGESAAALHELMDVESLETRYGAFRALSTVAPEDPFLNGIDLPGNFRLHLIDSNASPFIHLTRHKKAELVLFGAFQEFQLPMFVRAGSKILVRGTPSGDGVLLKRIAAGEAEQSQTVSTRVADVIRAAAEMGATYPDIVQMLIQAQRQHNLSGEIAIDKLPRPGRVYQRKPEDFGQETNSPGNVPIGNDGLMPNLFDELPNKTILPTAPPALPVPSQPQDESLESDQPVPFESMQAGRGNSFELE